MWSHARCFLSSQTCTLISFAFHRRHRCFFLRWGRETCYHGNCAQTTALACVHACQHHSEDIFVRKWLIKAHGEVIIRDRPLTRQAGIEWGGAPAFWRWSAPVPQSTSLYSPSHEWAITQATVCDERDILKVLMESSLHPVDGWTQRPLRACGSLSCESAHVAIIVFAHRPMWTGLFNVQQMHIYTVTSIHRRWVISKSS